MNQDSHKARLEARRRWVAEAAAELERELERTRAEERRLGAEAARLAREEAADGGDGRRFLFPKPRRRMWK